MKFDYFEMLTGEPIYIENIGFVRSPKLKEIFPNSGIGHTEYKLFLNFLSWDKKQLFEYSELMNLRGTEKLVDKLDKFSFFDIATILSASRELCHAMLSFYIVGDVVWDEITRSFTTHYEKDGQEIIGTINKKNFEEVRKILLQLNFVGLDEVIAETTYTSDKAKELWMKAQKHIAENAAKKQPEEHPEYNLGNIVSKLCGSHPSYNFLNVYDLTIFQLYDAFFQVEFLKSTNLSEMIYSHVGGDKFNFGNWLKPIIKINNKERKQ